MKCPTCKIKMDRFESGKRRTSMWECPKCDFTVFSKSALEAIKRSMRDCKEGRVYLWSCATSRGRCEKSKEPIAICRECHVDGCKNWYRLGKKEERRRKKKREGKASV